MKRFMPNEVENTSLHHHYKKEKDFCCMKMLSNGRIGRVQYLLCTTGITLFGLILAGLLSLIPVVGVPLALIYLAGMIAFNMLLTIQRCHDINVSGWLSVASFIPILSTSLYFISGTRGENQYGQQPSPCSTEAKAAVLGLVSIVVIGLIFGFSFYDSAQIDLLGNGKLIALAN